jgi:signal peptidase I
MHETSSRKRSGKGGLSGLKHGWNALKAGWGAFLGRLPLWLSPWVRDLVDVGLTVAVVIIVLKVLFRADMLVPLVVVTSGSMVHDSGDTSWIKWLSSRGLGEPQIGSFPMSSGFNVGDMILVKDPHATLGDVIIYERDFDHLTFATRDPIIHRVVGVAHVENYSIAATEGTLDCQNPQMLSSYVERIRQCQLKVGYCPYPRVPSTGSFDLFITKGDHNGGSDQCNQQLNIAYPVNDAQVTGRALLRLPYLGWPKLILNLIYRLVTLQV